MNETFITSDLHFWHKNILKFCKETRPWTSVEEMNEALIAEWNSKIKPNDTVYHLGDFCFGSKQQTLDILEQLNGFKVFITGNHDGTDIKQALKIHGKVYDYLEIKHRSTKLVLFHYPLACWNGAHYNSIMLYAHCHGSFENKGKSIDVGYDAQGKILTLDEAFDLANAKEKEILDGH